MLVSFSELREDPIDHILQSDVLYKRILRPALDLPIAAWALVSIIAFEEVANDAVLAEGAHAFIYRVSVAINTRADLALQVRKHLSNGWHLNLKCVSNLFLDHLLADSFWTLRPSQFEKTQLFNYKE